MDVYSDAEFQELRAVLDGKMSVKKRRNWKQAEVIIYIEKNSLWEKGST